jgi:preprotein translocase subunit SecF
MEILANPNIDWLGKKWIFLSISAVLALAGIVSMAVKGMNMGIDFTGGTLAYVKFAQKVELDRVRAALSRAGLKAEEVTSYDAPEKNEVQIRMERLSAGGEAGAQDLGTESNVVFRALSAEFDKEKAAGQVDLNNATRGDISDQLERTDPEQLRNKTSVSDYSAHYAQIAGRIVDYRTAQGGVISNVSGLSEAGVPAVVVSSLQKDFYLGKFSIISMESVGPKVGRELQTRARNAVLASLLGMLIYIAFRFKPIYGVAGVVALFHDVLITVGLFSLTGKEISLNVIAALLTLVGYSINDTIVVFDRVRENLRLVRRADLRTIINLSINQTLNRTLMTSGMTFLAVFSLYLFGGAVLNGFAFALTIGIIIGTYSSIAIASPIVMWWQTYTDRRKAKATGKAVTASRV